MSARSELHLMNMLSAYLTDRIADFEVEIQRLIKAGVRIHAWAEGARIFSAFPEIKKNMMGPVPDTYAPGIAQLFKKCANAVAIEQQVRSAGVVLAALRNEKTTYEADLELVERAIRVLSYAPPGGS